MARKETAGVGTGHCATDIEITGKGYVSLVRGTSHQRHKRTYLACNNPASGKQGRVGTGAPNSGDGWAGIPLCGSHGKGRARSIGRFARGIATREGAASCQRYRTRADSYPATGN